VQRKLRQREHPTEFPRDFHNGKALFSDGGLLLTGRLKPRPFRTRNSMVFRLEFENADIPARGAFLCQNANARF
jgi:hypothetical protein